MPSRIRLTGKHAIGDHAYTVVDDDMVAFLSQWRWKAKPNGSGTHVYAARNTRNADGTESLVRMHRVVLGYEGPLEIDHLNHDPLDNRRANLRVATRSQNQLNRQVKMLVRACCTCELPFSFETKNGTGREYCSDECNPHLFAFAPRCAVFFHSCTECKTPFVGHRRFARYCSESCKARAKWARWKHDGTFPASVLRNAERCKAWHQSRRDIKTLGSP